MIQQKKLKEDEVAKPEQCGRWVKLSRLELAKRVLCFERGVDGLPGKAGIDDDDNGKVDDLVEIGWPETDDTRSDQWEKLGDLAVFAQSIPQPWLFNGEHSAVRYFLDSYDTYHACRIECRGNLTIDASDLTKVTLPTAPPAGVNLINAALDIDIGGRHTGLLRYAVKSVRSEERRVGKECRSRWSPHH